MSVMPCLAVSASKEEKKHLMHLDEPSVKMKCDVPMVSVIPEAFGNSTFNEESSENEECAVDVFVPGWGVD